LRVQIPCDAQLVIVLGSFAWRCGSVGPSRHRPVPHRSRFGSVSLHLPDLIRAQLYGRMSVRSILLARLCHLLRSASCFPSAAAQTCLWGRM
jgi:hypothetical protein